MQALEERSRGARSPRLWLMIAGIVVLIAVAGGAYALGSNHTSANPALKCTSGVSCGSSGGGGGTSTTSGATHNTHTSGPSTLRLTGSTPTSGATTVASDTTVALQFNTAPRSTTTPTITPALDGTWSTSGTSLVFTPTGPFIPFTHYTVSVPGGDSGIVAADGAHLARSETVSFSVAAGSTLRLQQLLAQLGYLPVAYSEPAPAPAPQDMAMPQPGTFTWRWANLPSQLTTLWLPGTSNNLTKGAVEEFETQNGLSVDGLAGPKVWSTLLADVASGKGDADPYTYILVTKTLPEHLTAFVNGVVQFHFLVNTGVPGATTTPGTYEVFEHVKASDMKGTNVTGSTYTDPTVPWASYFNGGDALHGYPRATYGWPQSNGCVEMTITQAGQLWPYTPVGTVVTVQGPPAPT